MKFPRSMRTYCPRCKTHTEFNVSLYKAGKRKTHRVGERRFKKKFEAGKRHIPALFKGLDLPTEIDQIAVLVFASKQNRDVLGGGMLTLGNELLEEIFSDLQHRSIYSRTIPEQFPILRALQFVAQYRKEVCSILLSKNP